MKKKNKNKSLVSQTIHMFVIQSALLGIVIVTYICVSYYTVLENMQTSSRNLLQLYGKELENKLENADMLLERLIYKNNDYDMLQSEKESERYYASIEIKKFIQEQITYDQYVDAVVIGDSTYGSCLDYENSDMAYQEREDLMKIMNNIQAMRSSSNAALIGTGAIDLPGTSIRMAMAVIGILPIMLIYPFVQKYLVKGVVVGAVKG